MSEKKVINFKPLAVFALLLICVSFTSGAFAVEDDLNDWVNEGRWPRGSTYVEVTPEKQYAKAKRLQEIGDTHQAAEQFKRLSNAYFEAEPQAEESLVLSAKNFLAAGDYTSCREQLNELRRRYANPSYLDAIGEVEIKLGRGFLEGKGEGGTYRLASRIRKAREIFQREYDKDPQGHWADAALMGLGQCSETLGDFSGAIKRYKELLEKYPRSDLRAETESRIAACISKRSPHPDKTEADSDEARQRITEAKEAAAQGEADVDVIALEENERLLENRQAEKRFDQAVFYMKNAHYRAAEVYFELVKARYPNSPWAKKAEAELDKLKKR